MRGNFLPMVVVARGLIVGQSIATSGISHDTGTGVLSFTMVGHSAAVGDRLRVSFTGGSASPAMAYPVTAVAGDVVTLQVNTGGTAITAVDSSWLLKAGSSMIGSVTAAAASNCTFSFSNPESLPLGEGIFLLTGSATSTGTSAVRWDGIDSTAGATQRILMARAI